MIKSQDELNTCNDGKRKSDVRFKPNGNLTGKRFGRLTVICLDHKKPRKNGGNILFWKCKCDCGNEKVVNINNILKGFSKSCGCLISEVTTEKNKTMKQKDKHKYSDYSLYRTWISMRKRCYSVTEPAYKDYGGRGITVCDEWNSDYNSFLIWAKSNGYQKGLTIDRIDNDKGYYPDNCRFVDNYVQANNKRNNIKICFNNEVDTLPNWARKLKVSASMLYSRYYKNNDPTYIFRGIV